MKKVLSIIIAVILTVLLVGCSNSNNNTSSEYVASKGANESSNVERVSEAPTEDSSVKVTRTEKYKLIDGQPFENGIAWVTLKKEKENEKHKALVNKNGEIIYFADNNSDNINTTEFINGLAAVYPKLENISQPIPGFVIINTKGEVIYSCGKENMYMCGVADNGVFIILKHDSGFDHDKWLLCTLDKDLNLSETQIEVDKDLLYNKGFFELANGLYLYLETNNERLININNNSYIKAVVYTWYNYCGKDYLRWSDLKEDYFIPINLLSNAKTSEEVEEIAKKNSSVIHFKKPENTSELKFKTWNGGSYYRMYHEKDNYRITHQEYTDIRGNTIFTFPDFSDGVIYNNIDDFSGDYSAIYLTGVDGNSYVTIIDGNGKTKYDPVKIQKESWEGCSCNGFIFLYYSNDRSYEVVTPDGTIKHLGDDLSGIGNASLSENENNKITIGDGFILYNEKDTKKYISVDGKTTLDEFTAEYNSDNALIFTDKEGNKISASNHQTEDATNYSAQTDSTVEVTASSKNYVTTNNFSIVGKWKNVGDYTYGQAQKGSIIVFDGKNCNFFSPKDTYAFYKNGDNYMLDCTSPLADTVSFTVKIVDDNNIDVFNGSDIVELKRVS